ncbi:calcium/sodium antiporter [Yunchengibacter salinarum]|uniref:calcium/sodium antiporter n=1 Tax=Yunchengibacter salinarum TaxID=3133399 RepID=UPI0035B677DD
MAFLQAFAGLILLVVAGDALVRGSVSLARRSGVPVIIIGMTIVAFGTSAPELMVGIDAVLTGAPTLAMGNVVGSNIANILLVVSVPAMIAPVACHGERMGRTIGFVLAASLLFPLAGATLGGFPPWLGVLMTAALGAFLVYSARHARRHSAAAREAIPELEEASRTPDPVWLSTVLVVAGLGGLIWGADLLVEGSVTIARVFGVSEAVIGLTLVAIGTSLPELITGVMAALRGHGDVAIGNVVGSNLFNLLGIIGVSSLFGTIPAPDSFMRVDFWVMIATTLLLLPFYLTKRAIGRGMGIAMLVAYAGYLAYLASTNSQLVEQAL